MKAADYGRHTPCTAAFVATNSICQGQQVPILWPAIFATGHEIAFAHTSFKWANLASHNAGVTVVIVAITNLAGREKRLYSKQDLKADGTYIADGSASYDGTVKKEVAHINAYLVAGPNLIVAKSSTPITEISAMDFGNKPVDGGNLLLNSTELEALGLSTAQKKRFVRRIYGSAEFIRGLVRYCLWIDDDRLPEAMEIEGIRHRIEGVRAMRLASSKSATATLANSPQRFGEVRQVGTERTIIVPSVSSENREYLPCGFLSPGTIVSNAAFALYDAPLWNMALIASRLHLVWIATVCGKLKTDYRYSNTLGWNTFPVPALTEKNKADLSRCAERHPAGAGSPFPRHHRRPVCPRRHARKPAPRP